MSGSKEIKFKVECPFDNPSPNITIIVSGRCTSTPKYSNQVSPNYYEPNIDSIREKTNTDFNSLNHIIEFAPIPIFGRRNLKLLNNCVNKGINILSNQVKESLLRKEENVNESLTKPKIKNKFLNIKEEYKQPSFANISDELKLEIKNSVYKKSRNSIRLVRVSGVKAALRRFNDSTTKKRRSNHNDSKPNLKINSKRPKSPKLLTAIRAKLKQNRDKLNKENEKSKNAVKDPHVPEKKYATRINVKEYQTELHKREKVETDKISKLKQVKSSIIQPKDEMKKQTSFKAQPIRKYTPLPEIMKRSATVPHSPKLGKRRYLNSYH